MGRPSYAVISPAAAASSFEGARVAMRTSIVIHASFVSREPPARREKPFRSEDEDDEAAAAPPAVVGLAALKGVAIIISNTRSAAARPTSFASLSVNGGGLLSWNGPSSGSKSNTGAVVPWTSVEEESMG